MSEYVPSEREWEEEEKSRYFRDQEDRERLKMLYAEIAKWKAELQNCAHCQLCRDEIVRLYGMIPPRPMLMMEEFAMRAIASRITPDPQLSRDVERVLEAMSKEDDKRK